MPRIGMLRQVGEDAVERGGDRVEPGDQEEEADVEDLLVGEAVALLLRSEEVAEQVVTEIAARSSIAASKYA